MADPARGAPAGAGRPNAARVYDYLLGGKDNYAADRALGDALAQEGAALRELARINRRFVLKAATWAASVPGIGQFLDLGCGLPSRPAIHDAAREGHPGARVVYADNDPAVICHTAALQSGPGLAAVLADVSEPAKVLEVVTDLEAPGGGRLIDLTEPVAVVLGGTLSSMDVTTARAVVTTYTAALAPGSAVVISCASYADAELGRRMAGLYGAAGKWLNHDRTDVVSFFAAAGLRIAHGRVMDLACWPACPVTPQDQPGAQVIGGIGIKESRE